MVQDISRACLRGAESRLERDTMPRSSVCEKHLFIFSILTVMKAAEMATKIFPDTCYESQACISTPRPTMNRMFKLWLDYIARHRAGAPVTSGLMAKMRYFSRLIGLMC